MAEQNENDLIVDLQKKYETLRTRTGALLDSNPDIIFRMDSEGRYLDFHAPDGAPLAFAPSDFLGHRVVDLFPPEFASASERYITEALTRRETQVWEYPLTLQGETREYEARIVPNELNEVIVIIRDITDSKRAREQLHLSELRLNEAQRIAKIGSWERNLLTNEVWWSNEVYRLLELDPEKHAPSYKAFLQAVHIDDRAHVEETVASAARQGKPYSAHHRVVLANGDTRIFHDRAYVISDDQGKPVRLVGTLQDITEHAELERELVAVSENERDRIGRDLHDGLGQLLTGISLSLKTMAARLAEEHSRHTDLAQKLSATTQEAILETSRVARLLSPRISGLGAALERLASDLNSYPDVRCRIRCQADHDEHDPVIEAHLYRIAQEASSNALRHGKAMNVEMHYQCNGKSLRLEIVDDGVGISPLTSSLEGIGLRNMRYRARIICGILEVERRQEGGTRILCSCPCRSAAS